MTVAALVCVCAVKITISILVYLVVRFGEKDEIR